MPGTAHRISPPTAIFLLGTLLPAVLIGACSAERPRTGTQGDGPMYGLPGDLTLGPSDLAVPPEPEDLAGESGSDGACAFVSERANVTQQPVDIIWVVDNSSSMKPAVDAVTAGLNDFAALIGKKNLDYRIIMLSVRSATSPLQVGGSTRYPVCIPPPLAGDMSCGNGPNFFHSNIDIKSTQPLEQFLGTLGQTMGYTPGTSRGGEPWAQFLRMGATKTIVVVTDDNSRLSAKDFLHYGGGVNPNNANLQLPPGLLDGSWMGMFDQLTFDSIYGWGDPQDPTVMCKYQDGSKPASAGATYTQLVTQQSGVRAQICDGANAWGPFFDAVAKAVSQSSKLSCDLAIPSIDGGMLDPMRVNVIVAPGGGGMSETFVKVKDKASCGNAQGWYYDDDQNPTRVILCQAACEDAQLKVGQGAEIQIAFGCDSIIQ